MKYLDQIWCFIPARSGSSLKDKNIKKLNGKPLIYYSIETAFKSKCFDNVIFSSDSNKYIKMALKINKNLEIHKRNAKISTSTASEYSVFKNYIDIVAAKKKILPLYFAHLRPTNPIRNINTIKKVIKKFKKIKDQYSCLRMLNESSKPAFWSSMVNKDNRVYTAFNKDFDVNKLWLSRQSFEKTYFINCHIDIYKTKNILRSKSLWGNKVYGYIDNDYSIVDIDTIEDFKYAEYLMSQKKN